MSARHKLEQTIEALPLTERESLLSFVEKSISDEYDRLAAASIAEDMRMIERHLARNPITDDQMHELQGSVEAEYQPWDQVRQVILAQLRRGE